MDQRRTDTRKQLQAVALELFGEHGYDATSLREIAERLGISKAAVYYHFRSKEEILASMIEDFLAQLDELVQWGQAQPTGPDTTVEVLRRYSEMLTGPTAELARFMKEGRSAIHDLDLGMTLRARFAELSQLLAPADASVATRLRATIALSALHIGTLPDPDSHANAEQRRAAALTIAIELLTAASDLRETLMGVQVGKRSL
jgi:AcrR family transcriptional regulator